MNFFVFSVISTLLVAPTAAFSFHAYHKLSTVLRSSLREEIMNGLTGANTGMLGNGFGSSFESSVCQQLQAAGYQSLFGEPEAQIGNALVTLRSPSRTQALELDAVVVGGKKSFETLCSLYSHSFIADTPPTDHVALVKMKLTSNLLTTWLLDTKSQASRSSFRPSSFNLSEVIKIAVINGGKESQDFIDKLQGNAEEVRDLRKILLDSRINLFYKPGLSVESIKSYFSYTDALKDEIHETKNEFQDEFHETKKELYKIKKEIHEIKNRLDALEKLVTKSLE